MGGSPRGEVEAGPKYVSNVDVDIAGLQVHTLIPS
jgi:hypothetical protein